MPVPEKSEIWNANRLAVLVADWVLAKVKGIPGLLEAKFTVIVVVAKDTVEDACSAPLTWKAPATVEEAEDMNPPAVVSMPVVEALERVVTPVTLRVEESVVPPSTAKVP